MSSSARLIRPTNILRAKVGGAGFDSATIAKAEAALEAMSSQFGQWLQDEITKLEAAQSQIRSLGYNETTASELYYRAHDLKGLGGTYQYPLVTRMASSLSKLLDDPQQRLKTPIALLNAHIDAIRAVVRDRIQTEDHPTGRILAEALEASVAEYRSRPAAEMEASALIA
ncbi:MAG: Hpt domain-containing protein [Oxalobacteraceae bacterium]|nr:MAG: Hpt domain-containing protein [Oxalobacteraceae bacterium]